MLWAASCPSSCPTHPRGFGSWSVLAWFPRVSPQYWAPTRLATALGSGSPPAGSWLWGLGKEQARSFLSCSSSTKLGNVQSASVPQPAKLLVSLPSSSSSSWPDLQEPPLPGGVSGELSQETPTLQTLQPRMALGKFGIQNSNSGCEWLPPADGHCPFLEGVTGAGRAVPSQL